MAKPVPSVVVMGQDEFHDALESAAEAASTASSSSDRQAESGRNQASFCCCFHIYHYSCNDEKPTRVDALFLMRVTSLNGTASDPLACNAYTVR